MPRAAKVTFAAVRRIALALPGVTEGTSYGTAAFHLRGKFLLRLREDDETLAVRCNFDERDARMAADPEAFFITDHYRAYPAVCVRLSAVKLADLECLIESAWRRGAGKKLLAEHGGKS
jgi:hypothetical protein